MIIRTTMISGKRKNVQFENIAGSLNDPKTFFFHVTKKRKFEFVSNNSRLPVGVSSYAIEMRGFVRRNTLLTIETFVDAE